MKESINKNKRIDYIDVYRGIGIILMIMGHIYYGKTFYIFIHAFNMPMFFIISGFLFSNKIKDFKPFVKKKAKQLLIPYFVFGILHLIIFALLNLNNMSLIIKRSYALFFMPTNTMPICGAIWFLISLFFAELIYFFIVKISNRYIRLLVSFIISIIGIFLFYFFRLPYGIDVSMVAVLFMNVGTIIKENKDKIFNTNIFIMIIIGIITVFLIFANGLVGFKSMGYNIVPLFYLNAIVSSVLLLYISNLICNIELNKYKLYNCFKNILIHLGSNSIVYLIFNQLVIFILSEIFKYLNISTNYLNKLSMLPIVILILYLINKLLNNDKLKILIGR